MSNIDHSYFENLTGKPDLFITFTCNAAWPEITRELLPGQKAEDRPDLVSRVFKIKWNTFIQDITENQIFGRVEAIIYVIEFQKRCLPHGHTLVILHPDDKPRTPEDVDHLVCAELPDPEIEPELFHTVSALLLHGPCGVHNPSRACTKDGKCTKHYPRPFRDTTSLVEDSYPAYRRRNDGRTVEKQGFTFDNRYVVPYPKYVTFTLLRSYFSTKTFSEKWSKNMTLTSTSKFA